MFTMRKETEWIELAEAGVNRICGDDTELMMQSVNEFFGKDFPGCPHTYGTGKASEIIAASTLSYFNY